MFYEPGGLDRGEIVHAVFGPAMTESIAAMSQTHLPTHRSKTILSRAAIEYFVHAIYIPEWDDSLLRDETRCATEKRTWQLAGPSYMSTTHRFLSRKAVLTMLALVSSATTAARNPAARAVAYPVLLLSTGKSAPYGEIF